MPLFQDVQVYMHLWLNPAITKKIMVHQYSQNHDISLCALDKTSS